MAKDTSPPSSSCLRENLRCGILHPIFDRDPASRRLFHDACIGGAKVVIFYWGRQYAGGCRSTGPRTTGVLRPGRELLLYYLGPPETEAKRTFNPTWGISCAVVLGRLTRKPWKRPQLLCSHPAIPDL